MDNQQTASSNKGASFIKVLGRDFSKQLQLPEDFTMNMNGYVPHRFIIESGITKKCWRVEVKKDGDGRMYFRDGWDDFVDAHSLEVGNFLLFEYEEQSIFQVRIFYKNGCERTMLLVETKKRNECEPQKAIDDEEEEGDYGGGGGGGGDTEPLEFEPVIVKCREPKTQRLAPKKFGTGIHKTRPEVQVPRSYKRTAKVSVTENIMSFSVVIHHNKKHQFYQLTVPKAISLKMKLPSKDEVKLQDAEGNSWNVKLAHRRDDRVIFFQGWKEFLTDNKVSPRDKLHFQVVSEDVIQVSVKSSKVELEPKETNSSIITDCKHNQPNTTCAPKDKAIGIPEVSKSAPEDKAVETPETSKRTIFHESISSFSVMWKESTVRTYLYVPAAIVQGQNLMKKDNIVLRDPDGKCWPLEVKKSTGNRVVLAKGWVEFWRGYGLNHGDFLTFEFVSENLMQVSIEKRNKPLFEPELEDEIIFLGAKDTENATVIEPEVGVSHEKLNAEIEPEVDILPEGFDASVELELDAAPSQPGADDVTN